jgi:hypothetical protein
LTISNPESNSQQLVDRTDLEDLTIVEQIVEDLNMPVPNPELFLHRDKTDVDELKVVEQDDLNPPILKPELDSQILNSTNSYQVQATKFVSGTRKSFSPLIEQEKKVQRRKAKKADDTLKKKRNFRF